MLKKLAYALWFLTIFFLLVYSFTQVDLNLTLSRVPIVNNAIKNFQAVGYFQRPLSTAIFLAILSILYILYLLFIYLARQGIIKRREFWLLLIVTGAILLFSYPAFSYDLFNYMFDAKTVVYYHQNPWLYAPLHYKGDHWLNFMHWTHRPSVYPPGWVLLTLPFYFFGFNIFLLTLFNFKLLMTLSFIGSVWVLEKLLFSCHNQESNNKMNMNSRLRRNDMAALVFYALNPLMLIENLVSSHNDIVMMFFILLSFFLATQRKKLFPVLCSLFSVLIKYITGVLFPIIFFYGWIRKKTTDLNIYRYSLIITFLFFLIFINRVEIQPWYLVWLMPFVVLSGWDFLWPAAMALSLGLMLRYAPFLFRGDWGGPVPFYKFWLTVIPILVSLLVIFKHFLSFPRRRESIR